MNTKPLSNLFIPFTSSPSIGGPHTFMVNLQKFMDKEGINYKTTHEGASGIFFPIQFDEEIIKSIKSTGGKVIQRLDGIYYPSQHGEAYKSLNRDIKEIYLNYADYVIFQSAYSKKQCFNMLGEKDNSSYSIIVNGVWKDLFYPKINYVQNNSFKFITTGVFRKRIMMEPIVIALDSLKDKYDFELFIVGPIILDELKDFINRKYIKYIERADKDVLGKLFRECNIFIHSQINDNCPNAVLEAISSGLPVVGFDSGAMSELCWFSKDLLSYVSNDIFQKYEDFKPELLAEKIELCISNYSHYREIALKYAHLYSFNECGAKYLEIFNKVLKDA